MSRRRLLVGLSLSLGLGGILALAAVQWLRHSAPEQNSETQATLGGDAGFMDSDSAVSGLLDSGSPTPPNQAAIEVQEPLWVPDSQPETLAEQRAQLFRVMKQYYPEAQVQAVEAIFSRSKFVGQGNPEPTEHPMTRQECLEIRGRAEQLAEPSARCQAPHMVPVYAKRPIEETRYADGGALPEGGPSAWADLPDSAETASLCVDQYEFPNIPCEYPVVYAQANEAHELCQALGKRLCDAHEWEGACAGDLRPIEVEYAFGDRRMLMQWFSNTRRQKVWAYGEEKNHAKCATSSFKNPKCGSGSFKHCGSNTYPAGAFPECVSPFGVYDLHGNAAEHMNLPLAREQLMSQGGAGETEMKGSWFIFNSYEAHEDDCRYRAPAWHVTSVTARDSHRNYHLGFRCCKDI